MRNVFKIQDLEDTFKAIGWPHFASALKEAIQQLNDLELLEIVIAGSATFVMGKAA